VGQAVHAFAPSGDKSEPAGFSAGAGPYPLERCGTVWKTRLMLILASQSATRKDLLTGAGLSFAAHPAEIDERAVENTLAASGASAGEIACHLAIAKAAAVAAHFPRAVVIGADQVLSLSETRLNKPASLLEAGAQLDLLRGRVHYLHTGVAIVCEGRLQWSHVATAALTMRNFSARERDAVLAVEGEAVLGSVGGYLLEGPSIRLFESIEGDYFSILGLPLLPLLGALRHYAPNVFEEEIA
jgi:septum formation protein